MRQSSSDFANPASANTVTMPDTEPTVASSRTCCLGLLATIREMVSRGFNQTESQGDGEAADSVVAFMNQLFENGTCVTAIEKNAFQTCVGT